MASKTSKLSGGGTSRKKAARKGPDAVSMALLKRVVSLRSKDKEFDEIAVELNISVYRAKQLYARSQRLESETHEGKLLPPTVRQALDRGPFNSVAELKSAILDGQVKYTGEGYRQSTIPGIGRAKFSELCAFLGIDERSLPHSVPIEARIAAQLNNGVEPDEAFAELVGWNKVMRKTIRTVVNLTANLSPKAMKQLQQWARET